ncbi:MAG: mannose-1-phosphate guanylyltransferase [Candidatus Dojkabacteria bacterium]|nr:MAG: mannose-1-phosphate guanylyltransferase [Candidatus Dojkabacteria bacterium]
MKIIIFAGGVGKRLWPLSTKKAPKQFQKLFGDETSLENSYRIIKEMFDENDIFVCTNEAYSDQVYDVIPNLPRENLIIEPESRDTGPAIANAMKFIAQKFPNEPVVIRWQNSLIKDTEAFLNALKDAKDVFEKKEGKFVYLCVPARYANTGVGYIKFGKKVRDTQNSMGIFEFEGFTEKPDLETATKYVQSGNYGWNPGCYVTTPQFVLEELKRVNPEFYNNLEEGKFSKLEKISIDYLLWEHLNPQNIKVVLAEYGWYYVSTWKDLKIALENNPTDNVTKGQVFSFDSNNNLAFNFEDKLVTLLGMENVAVINTPNATLVLNMEKAGDVKKLLEKLEENNLDNFL